MKCKILCIGLIMGLLTIYSCEEDQHSGLEYTECTPGEIINRALRQNEVILPIVDWPIDIREYIAGEFPGYKIESITSYTLYDVGYFIAKMGNKGYVLFDANHVFRCADGTFNGGSRIDITFDPSLIVNDTVFINTDTIDMGMDTTSIDPDTLIVLIETNVCDADIVSFERQILPLMASGCAYGGCHDANTAEDGVILETYAQIRSNVSPGSSNGGKIMRTLDVTNMNSNKFMPPLPAISFTTEQTELVRTWINQGANDTDCFEPCNSLNISFSQNVFPILEDQCLGCHQPTNDLGGVILDTYDNIMFSVNDGELLGSIQHENGFDPMPEVALKLTDCQIATIENWITDGAKNN